MRMIKDAEGRSWRVWHVVPQSQVLTHASPELQRGWICFERDGEKRRLVSPPEEWEQLPDAELLTLLARAERVKAIRA